MKKTKKAVAGLLIATCAAGLMTGCGKESYEAMDTGASGSIDVMMWDGTGKYFQDIGHQEMTAADFGGTSEASVYAVAKAFNEKYPNVKINLWAIPWPQETSWAQEIENFKAQYGKYPDFYQTDNLAGEVTKGMAADLSVFQDDEVYQSFNPAIMKMMNYYGVQGGLPQAVNVSGVFVNKELAEQNNIDVPPVDWNFDEYTAFISSADCKNFWGAMDANNTFISTGCKDVYYSLANYNGTGDHVNLTSDAVSELLEYIPKWVKYSIWPNSDIGDVPTEFMDANGWWGYNFFINNAVLTHDGDPWMLDSASNPAEGFWGTAKSNDWDYYPYPSTEYAGNTVGLDIVPMAVHNYAMDDGNPELSDEEMEKLKLTYTFASFFVGSKEAMEAKANQMYLYEGTETPSLNNSMPLVQGDLFDEYMEVWYSIPTHQRFADEKKMPGFHKILELFKNGELWTIGGQVYTYYVEEDGEIKSCLYEWDSIGSADVAGALRTDPNWLDQVKAKLPDWNENINARFEKADQQLRDGLKEFYGLTDADF